MLRWRTAISHANASTDTSLHDQNFLMAMVTPVDGKLARYSLAR
jgi:hypothetical protein